MKTELLPIMLILGPIAPVQAFAEVYMSGAQAVNLIFSGQNFELIQIDLAKNEIERIEKESDVRVRAKKLTLWRDNEKNSVFIDQVLGKHEFISYAVGIAKNGKVVGIEILEYRESYGVEVRRPEWRKQFYGKDSSSKLKLDDSIQNIAGATLSSAHITDGVKRLLRTYDAIRSRI